MLPLLIFAANPDVAHPHTGLLTPVTAKPALADLSPGEVKTLEAGEVVLQQVERDDGGVGVAVQYVDAPAAVVWKTILAYHRYTSWVKHVESCEVYKTEGNKLWVDMQMSTFGFDYGLYTINTVRKDDGWMSWHLDYSRTSDVHDMTGYWLVTELDKDSTRLDYSSEVLVKNVPAVIAKFLTQSSLSDGTAWVKREAERTWERMQ